jgi:hypothetical protein
MDAFTLEILGDLMRHFADPLLNGGAANERFQMRASFVGHFFPPSAREGGYFNARDCGLQGGYFLTNSMDARVFSHSMRIVQASPSFAKEMVKFSNGAANGVTFISTRARSLASPG